MGLMDSAHRTDSTDPSTPAHDSLPDFWAIIPAGGAGTRLWPLSRKGAPKFLLDLTGSGRTLLQATWDRLTPLAQDRVARSEERRVGKECERLCRSRWSPYH